MARQHGRPIYYLTANFQVPEDGLEHQDRMPDVPAPELGRPMADLARQRGPEAAEEWRAGVGRARRALRRHVAMGLPDDPDHPARAQLWIRIAGELADDPVTAPGAPSPTPPT